MLEKTTEARLRYEEIAAQLNQPETYADPALVTRLNREQKELAPLAQAAGAYEKRREELEQARQLMEDAELREMARQEVQEAQEDLVRLEEELKRLLLPADPDDGRDIILEIRAGVGGEESALFAHSLQRMYAMYAEKQGWRWELAGVNETELGGVKEVSLLIQGTGVYARLKFESGVHRVQRVPETESGGRIHTSTVTVAVLPQVDEVDFHLDPGDLKIDTFRSSGAGGQHVNKTESAIRITHLPSGVVVECQDQRSQYKNKDRAMAILRSRLYEAEVSRQQAAIASDRRSQVGTGMRNERIRTYNFPQGRLTDHRIGLTLYKLEDVMNGDLDDIINGLIMADQAQKLKAGEES